VDKISTPKAASAMPNSTNPVLSETEINARRMGMMSDMDKTFYKEARCSFLKKRTKKLLLRFARWWHQ
jgi:hypothetical protein